MSLLLLLSICNAGEFYGAPGLQITTINTDRIVYPEYVPGWSISTGYEFHTSERYHLALDVRYMSSGYGWHDHSGSVEGVVRSHSTGVGIVNRWLIRDFDIVLGMGYMHALSMKDGDGNAIKHKTRGVQVHGGLGYQLFTDQSLRVLYTEELFMYYNNDPSWGRGYSPYGIRIEWCFYI